ncbi:zinc finger protein 16-like isoform X2 [Corticium candelabrum]|nr:zinc finger protein 16-like isoform X2 [Corticium candelabrum]
MEENGSSVARTLTSRYNGVLSRSPVSPARNTTETAKTLSSWEDSRKMKVARRYKYSRLDWCDGTREGSNERRNHVNGYHARKAKSQSKRSHCGEETQHVSENETSIARKIASSSFPSCTETGHYTTRPACNPAEQLRISQVLYTKPLVGGSPHCGASMTAAAALASNAIATGHACSVCGKIFSNYDDLSNHIVTHIQEASQPMVRCPFCKHSFNDPVVFFEHTATHVDDNPFQTVFNKDKIRTQSQESIKESDHLSPSASIANQPTTESRQFRDDTETHESERSRQFELDRFSRRRDVNVCESNATRSDASADSGVSSLHARTAPPPCVPSPPVPYCLSPLTSAHSVTKTHFCFTGSAAGAMSSIEKSYDYTYSPPSSSTPSSSSTDTSNAPHSAISRVANPTAKSVCSDSSGSLSPSFQAVDSPLSDTPNTPSLQAAPTMRESDTQERRRPVDTLTTNGFRSLSERPRHCLPQRRRRSSFVQSDGDTVSIDRHSEDEMGHGDYIPARRKRAGSHSGCLQLPRAQVTVTAPPAPAATNVCSTCGKSFRLRAYLRIHQRLHTGELPYPCHVCGKRFNQSWNRNVHMRVHSGIHPHRCKLCCKNFRSAVRLREHLSVIHCLSENEIAEKMKQSALEDMANEMHGRE